MNPALLLAFAALAPTSPGQPHHGPGGPGGPPPVAVRVERGDLVERERDRGYDRGGHDGWEVQCPRDVDAAFAALDQALYELADDVDDLKGRDKRHMRENLAALASAAEEARERSCRSYRAPPPPPVVVLPPPPPPRAVVLDNGAHQNNINAMKRESFDDGKLRIIDTAIRGDVCLTSPQVKDYMRTMSFSSNRLDILRRLAPRLVDDGNAITIYTALDFETDKNDARQVLTTTKTLAQCRLPYRP